MATSVPPPMAMPTSAAARAGASLMPSPTIATTAPPFFSSATVAALSAGSTSACTSSICSASATTRALPRLSPVIRWLRICRASSAAIAAAAPSLRLSPKANRPSTRGCGALSTSQESVRPSASNAGRYPAARPVAGRIRPACADCPAPAATVQRPAMPRPLRAWLFCTSGTATPSASQRSSTARASGVHCPLQSAGQRRLARHRPAHAGG